MKTNTAIWTIAITLAMIVGTIGFAAATTVTYDSSVTLENKDTTTWQPIVDDIGVDVDYNAAADEFEWSAFGKVALPDTEYSLVYYADKQNRFVNWGGDNPGVLIGTMTSNNGGVIGGSGSIDLGMNLPDPSDWNANPDPDYCDYHNDFDDYDHCSGAKLWMIPSDDYTEPTLTAWNPANYLFETDLITYTKPAVISIGDVTSCNDDFRPVTLPVIVSNAYGVGSMQITVSYDPSLITVTGMTGGNMDDMGYYIGTGYVNILASQGDNTGLTGTFDLADITFTPVANGACDLTITVTSFLDDTDDTLPMSYTIDSGEYYTYPFLNGDVNSNGVVDSGDVMVLAKYLIGLTGFETIDECASDVDGNYIIDTNDIVYLARYLLGDPAYDPLK